MTVIKRDGKEVPFNKNKIIDAINSAFLEVDGKLYETDTAEDIAEEISKIRVSSITVENIQDLVEEYLMRSERKDVARAYVRYRYKKEVARNYQSDFVDAIAEKLTAKNVQNQNANVDEYSFGGRMGEAASVMTKKYALEHIVSDMARKNHENNEIYIHDLDAYAVGSHNCLSIPFDDLLAKGFNTRQADIRPANSVGTAFQLVAVIFQLQSLQQFGGVSATHLDWTMVPYMRKSFAKHFKDGIKYCYDSHIYWDNMGHIPNEINFGDPNDECHADFNSKAYKYAIDMTEKELNQAVEAMYHNLSNWVA